MFETMEKLMLAGLGAMSMTKEHAEKVFDEYLQRGEAEKLDRGGFVKDLEDAAARGRKHLDELIAKHVASTLSKLHLATREDLSRLEEKLDAILKRE